MRLRRIAAGLYETPDGKTRIVRTEWDKAGPRGGEMVLWEAAYYSEHAGWIIGQRRGPWETLRAAREALS